MACPHLVLNGDSGWIQLTLISGACVVCLPWRQLSQLLQMKAYPSKVAKLPIVAAMLTSLMAPLAVDRFCVMLFDPALHKARKTGPPLGREVIAL